MSLHHALSKLLTGELPPEEAAALRQRIAQEPDVAAAWEAMQQMLADIETLPEIPPPLGLNAKVLDTADRQERRAWWATTAAFALAAAAVGLLWILWPPQAPPAVVAVAGQQWAEGELLLLAGDVTIEVDGRITVSVEPPGGGGRAIHPHTQEGDMNRAAVIAALAGSAVTVAVYEGSAIVYAGDDTSPITLHAGEAHTVPQRTAPLSPTAATMTPDSAPTSPKTAQTIRRLEAELGEAREALEALQIENAFNRGQLEAHQGQISSWPDTVPEQYTEQFLRDNITAQLETQDLISLDRMECEEYPCLVVLKSTSTVDGWQREVEAALSDMSQENYDDETSFNVNNSEFNHDGHVERFTIIAVSNKENTTDTVRARLDYRMDDLVDTLGSEVEERAETVGAP